MNARQWDQLVRSWGTRTGLSEHTRRAIAFEADGRREPGEPVPGCPCPTCATYAHGGDQEDADVAEWLVERLAREARPDDRQQRAENAVAAWTKVGCTLPSATVICDLARRVPGALPPRGVDRDPLPLDVARTASIRQVAGRLGLGDTVDRGGEPRVICPFHDDTNPSLRLHEGENLWYCDVCVEGGDGIRLVEKALDLEFADATRWIADGGRAGKSGIVTTGGRR